MTTHERLVALSKEMGKLHGWEGGGLIEIWIDSQGAQHIHMDYSIPSDPLAHEPRCFHTVERIKGPQVTLDQMADQFIKECREGD